MEQYGEELSYNERTKYNLRLVDALKLYPGDYLRYKPFVKTEENYLNEKRRYTIRAIIGYDKSGTQVFKHDDEGIESSRETYKINKVYFCLDQTKGEYHYQVFDGLLRIEDIIDETYHIYVEDLTDAVGEQKGYGKITLEEYLLLLNLQEQEEEDDLKEVERMNKLKTMYSWIQRNTPATNLDEANSLFAEGRINPIVIQYWLEEGYLEASKALQHIVRKNYPNLFNDSRS